MRALILLTMLMAAPAFAHDHNSEEIVEAAIDRKVAEGVRAPITDFRTVNPNRVAFHIAHGEIKTMVNQQGRVLVDSDANAVDPMLAMISNSIRRDFYQRSAPRSRVERLQGLMPRPPLPPQRSVIPELGSVVVLANTPLSGGSVGLEIDLGTDVRLAID